MGFKWPRLLYELDCEPIGYPGVVVEVVLNPEPLEEDRTYSGVQGDSEWYHSQARFLERVVVPGEYRDDGENWEYEIPDAQALWALEREPGFDARILLWAVSQLAQLRYTARPDAVKN